MRQEITKVIALFILSTSSFTDVRLHEISPFCAGAGGIAGLVVLYIESGQDIPLPASMLPGVCFLLFSFLSRGAVGAGDGLILIALAGCLSVTDTYCSSLWDDFGIRLCVRYAPWRIRWQEKFCVHTLSARRICVVSHDLNRDRGDHRIRLRSRDEF